jgi:hypothetical protein
MLDLEDGQERFNDGGKGKTQPGRDDDSDQRKGYTDGALVISNQAQRGQQQQCEYPQHHGSEE